jgi:hypothetical protein
MKGRQFREKSIYIGSFPHLRTKESGPNEARPKRMALGTRYQYKHCHDIGESERQTKGMAIFLEEFDKSISDSLCAPLHDD